MSITDKFKYLGVCIDVCGSVTGEDGDLSGVLDRLRASALKPHQKFVILLFHVLPVLVYQLTVASVNNLTLDRIDRLVRGYIKTFLHLPQHIPTAFLLVLKGRWTRRPVFPPLGT